MPCYFSRPPKRVLLVKRIRTDDVTAIAVALTRWLQEEWDVTPVVEAAALQDYEQMGARDLEPWPQHCGEELDAARATKNAIDMVISLGGDGTTLWVSTMFDDVVPPVIGVSLGSLSYLNHFTTEELLSTVSHILRGNVFRVQLRSRLFVMVVNAEEKKQYSAHCVNEAVVDRGSSSTLALLDVYVNGRYFTNVSADGLILGTPTGSTAYSMSAGGAMVHPDVPCILFTPICPHSLSMRPLLLPDTAVIRLKLPDQSRGSLWLSIDGRIGTEVHKGDSIIISLSPYPFPLVCKSTYDAEDSWLQALTDHLNWGLRIRQRHHLSPSAEVVNDGKSYLDYRLPPDLRSWCEEDVGEKKTDRQELDLKSSG